MSLKEATVLVVDDERSITDLLYEDLIEEGYNCITAATGEEALNILPKYCINVVLLDLGLPGMSGMDVLKEAKAKHPEVAVIVVTGAGDAQTAVEAMKTGAADYITKPFQLERLNSSLEATIGAENTQNSRPAPKEDDAETADEAVDWTRLLDSIAKGVETKLHSFTGHVITLTVIERTISLARKLEIPDDHIEKWADYRRQGIEMTRALDNLTEKMRQGLLPGEVPDISQLYRFEASGSINRN